ncbi:MAG: MXAN_6640 family putative metalloprotease, partial [Candidatus Zixiibacteriota bacterium]
EAQALIDFDTLKLPLKCATPVVINYVSNFHHFDKAQVDRYSLALSPRPNVTNETFNSPGGHFKIHYTRSGFHAVFQSGATTGGVPNFVRGVATICDSVYEHHINTRGYPVPPSDGGYPSGVDSLYDVYINNLGGAYYGLTYPDSTAFTGSTFTSTSIIVIDNDYQESGFGNYRSNPLNAVRVTMAHEFFHSIHFGIDASEMEEWNNPSPALRRPYWWEISAVWMEEEMYDDINDYYSVLPFFFEDPGASIQQFDGPGDFHPYAASIFAVFLDERFGPDIIRYAWLRSGQLGPGPQILEALQDAIDSATAGAENFRSVFGEFTFWNYFTGPRAAVTPPNVGYSERAFYPEIPDSVMTILDSIPATLSANANPKNPEPNGAAYFRINNTRAVVYDPPSTDTNLRVVLVLGNFADSALPQGWHIYQINQSDLYSNQYSYTSSSAPDDANRFITTPNPRQYRSITFALAPASWRWEPYTNPDWDSWFGYFVTDSLVDSLIDTVLTIDTANINVPAAVLTAYPNPAVIKAMAGQNLRFRFKIPTDSISIATYSSPYCVIDIYTLSGEYIKTVDTVANPYEDPNPYIRTVLFEIDWNMKTEASTDISSGVYICLARLYSSQNREELLAENRAKVLVIR